MIAAVVAAVLINGHRIVALISVDLAREEERGQGRHRSLSVRGLGEDLWWVFFEGIVVGCLGMDLVIMFFEACACAE